GNDNLHALTSSGYTVLRVDMSDFEGVSAYAEYNSFNVEDAAANYRMVCSGYSGNAGDSLSYSNGTQFSTFDDDNDSWGDSCASRYHGAFWYLHCHGANPNGAYLNGAYLNGAYLNTIFPKWIKWSSLMGHKNSLKFIEMKLRKE
ncbi:hypothetical protein CAPTEDRAFT_135023, partial [Capitella teleta]